MKRLLYLTILLAACGETHKYRQPAVVTQTTTWRQVHGVDQVATLQKGDTVDLGNMKSRADEEEVMVTLKTGQRGFVPTNALAIPDSSIERRTPQQIVDEATN